MKYAFCLVAMVIAAFVIQLGLLPAFLPQVLRPDIGLIMGFTVLALCPREFGLITLFALGLQADLFGSARFGLLTICYLLAAGIILFAAWRELTRGDIVSAWIGGIAGTALAHTLYFILGRIIGLEISWGGAIATIVSLLIAAAVWGLPCAYVCGNFMFRMRILTLPIQSRWAAEARMASSRRKARA